ESRTRSWTLAVEAASNSERSVVRTIVALNPQLQPRIAVSHVRELASHDESERSSDGALVSRHRAPPDSYRNIVVRERQRDAVAQLDVVAEGIGGLGPSIGVHDVDAGGGGARDRQQSGQRCVTEKVGLAARHGRLLTPVLGLGASSTTNAGRIVLHT